MAQSERVVDLMIPMDNLVDSLSLDQHGPYMLNAAKKIPASQSLVLLGLPTSSSSIIRANQTIEFGRNNEFSSPPRNLNPTTHNEVMNETVLEKKGTPVRSTKPHPTIVGDSETEMTFVTDALDPIFSGFYAIASELGIDLEVVEDSDLPGVIAAPRSLQEAVSNLLDNAVKYVVLPKEDSPFASNPSPRVRVRILATKRNPTGVTIIVEDNGPGIKMAEAEDIFKRGFRGELTKAVKGSGIGLDISQALIQRMGGNLVLADNQAFENCLDGAVMALTLYRD
jgi:hypothetical protein